ncbi:5-oxoprolinase subunit B family protein [Demequina sp. SO4-13]|uniref:5-oxoprolinase subunit B family protein n=1 Tax=Demequina sp. SO4-13 TaxID=3401027 RepID=UPI003AF72DBB
MNDPITVGDLVSRVRRAGAHGLLIELSDPTWVTALDAQVRQQWGGSKSRGVWVRDIVPAARTLLLDGIDVGDDPGRELSAPGAFDPGALEAGAMRSLIDELTSWTLTPLRSRDARSVEVPVVFDGPDLKAVAEMWDMTVAEAVATVVGCDFQVAFCGFAPGFAYMSGLPPERSVPRRSIPRTRVPAGAFGLAGEYAGIYPRSSPGGWQLLGTAVEVLLWDEGRQDPALLTPGTRVRVHEHPGAER